MIEVNDPVAKSLGFPFPHCPVSEELPFAISLPVSWVTGKVEDTGDGFIVFPDHMRMTLPVEFWNHQLLDVDTSSDDSLMSFLEAWGIPYHPFRNHPKLSREKRESAGIADTEKELDVYVPRPRPGEVVDGRFIMSKGSPRLSYISKKELVASINHLKRFVGFVVYGWNYDDLGVIDTINWASCAPRVLATGIYVGAVSWEEDGIRLPARGLLTSAICNQIIESFTDEAEWRRCACEGCNRVFKRKQPDQSSTKPDSDSKYCCTRCKNRQAKRNQRAAAKARIQH